MIVVAGRIRVRPERRAEATRAALVMAEATRREAGCLSYAFYADLVDPDAFLLFEEWESEAALLAHFQTEHMARFLEETPSLLAEAPAIRRYTVTGVSAM
jgi:quinol monooxygenase YgiN